MKLEITVGGFFGPSFKVTSDDLVTVDYHRSAGSFFRDVPLRITPAAATWAAFWEAVEPSGDWRHSYHNPEVQDGTQWEVHIVSDRLCVESTGSNAYPDGWEDFLRAVRLLVGGRPFAER